MSSRGGSDPGSSSAFRRALLARLYAPDVVDRVAAEVERLIARRGGRAPATVHWDETDAWLIAYPDQFRREGEPPLRTLGTALDRHLAPWLSGVHVTPFTPWTSDEGYSVVDYRAVDERYGTWADVEALARRHRLMLDAVVNHLSSGSHWFRGFLADEPPYRGFFRTADPAADLSATARPRSSPLLTRFEAVDGPRWVWTTFSPDQVDLDYANPAVLVAVLDVLLEYADRGAQALRLDAIAYLWKQEGTTSLHLPQTHAVVQLIRSVLTAVYPRIVLVTETNVPHEDNVAYFGSADAPEAHAVYQFALPPLVLHAMLAGDAGPLQAWATDLAPPREDTTFLTFLASHDGVGLRPAEGLLAADDVERLVAVTRACGGRVGMRALADGTAAPYELNATWFSLLRHGRTQEAALAAHLASHAIMLALQGLPLLYVHSLFATVNDDEGYRRTGEARSLNRRRFRLAELESRLAHPASAAATSWRGLRTLLDRRRATPAFHPGSRQRVLGTAARVFGVEREAADGQRARVYVNVSADPVTVEGPRGGGWTAFDERPVAEALRLGPYASCWLRSPTRS